MKKSTNLAILSVVSAATILVPLSTSFAAIEWMMHSENDFDKHMNDFKNRVKMHSANHFDRYINDFKNRTNKHIEDMQKRMNAFFPSDNSKGHSTSEKHHSSHTHPYHHVNHKRREQQNHHVERTTHHYIEHKKTTHHHIHEHHVQRDNPGDALAAGLLGLATGAILGKILKKPEQPPIIYHPMPQRQVVYQEVPQMIYQQAPRTQIIYKSKSTITHQPLQQPWTRNWLQYCKKKYRSFNPQTGTFRGYDGQDHFCYAPLN
ncbi:exonuclease VII large subunit [Bartonella fuyuanensis]|uniref:Lectin-like protein BA14k n=1 Tax=Bartonella fuyuanensis TaxID=1460968 RepID=A0A840E0R0_9HYPH|nr:BA14K family protein [Bartonella fuyuanensis]MBB4076517.1 exonuclease VII large subunit [Bartonella fuyuanensis]